MKDVLGYGDDSNETCDKFDYVLDDLEVEKPRMTCASSEDNNVTRVNKKSNHCYGNFGKGKELKLNINMVEIKAFLEEKIEEEVEEVVEKTKITHDFDYQLVEEKDKMRLNNTSQFDVADSKRKDDFGFNLEASREELHETYKMKREGSTKLDVTNRHVVIDEKREADAYFRLDTSRHKVQKTYESAYQPLWREDRMRLNDANELAVAEKKETDCNSRFEATTQMLHASYERLRASKQQKQIQSNELKNLVVEQPRCKAKSKGKSSLRQRLMTIGTRNSIKKFHPFVY